MIMGSKALQRGPAGLSSLIRGDDRKLVSSIGRLAKVQHNELSFEIESNS